MTREEAAPALPGYGVTSLALVLVCLGLGAVSALEARHMALTHGESITWDVVLASTLPRWILLAATLPLALRLALRPTARPLRPAHVLQHVALFGAISAAQAVVLTWSHAYAAPAVLHFPWPARALRSWYNALSIMISMYGAVLAAAWALQEARERERRSVRASQLEAQLQTARLAALRGRLRPHFLYNTLHAIAALVVDRRSTQAVAAIEQLSDLLHASLRDDEREEIALGEELALTERYLALQQMRFGERLSCRVDVAPALRDCSVPVLLLQPLVENAVVHGLEAGQARVHVVITGRATGDSLELCVENDGRALDVSAAHGVGLSATEARLLTAYGDRASLRLLPRPSGGALVRVTLPLVQRTFTAPARRTRSLAATT